MHRLRRLPLLLCAAGAALWAVAAPAGALTVTVTDPALPAPLPPLAVPLSAAVTAAPGGSSVAVSLPGSGTTTVGVRLPGAPAVPSTPPVSLPAVPPLPVVAPAGSGATAPAPAPAAPAVRAPALRAPTAPAPAAHEGAATGTGLRVRAATGRPAAEIVPAPPGGFLAAFRGVGAPLLLWAALAAATLALEAMLRARVAGDGRHAPT